MIQRSSPFAYRRQFLRVHAAALLRVLLATLLAWTSAEAAGVFDVRDHGAKGDGRTSDTAAINEAVRACAAAGGGQVLFPPGKYLSGTVHLKSDVTLFLEAGATLVGTTDLDDYQNFSPPSDTPEARWGKWHRALILGADVERVAILGSGTIDGNKVFDPRGEEKMRGPHTILIGTSREIAIRDVTIRDSANYAVMLEFCSEVDIRGVRIVGGWDGVHFRGWPGRPCRNVSIVGCQLFTGDDAIAGRYWEDVLISDCVLNSSCNCVRIIGPAVRLKIHDCLLYGPGLHPHRTSSRHNTLAGLNLQPGGWDATEGPLDDVLISDLVMLNVATPFHFTLKGKNTAGKIVVTRVSATGVYRSASSVESWGESPFGEVVFRDVDIEFEGGGLIADAEAPVKGIGVDPRPLPSWGFYGRNVRSLRFEDVRLVLAKDDLRPAMILEGVETIVLDGFRYSRSEGAAESLRLGDAKRRRLEDVRACGVTGSAPPAPSRAPPAGQRAESGE